MSIITLLTFKVKLIIAYHLSIKEIVVYKVVLNKDKSLITLSTQDKANFEVKSVKLYIIWKYDIINYVYVMLCLIRVVIKKNKL